MRKASLCFTAVIVLLNLPGSTRASVPALPDSTPITAGAYAAVYSAVGNSCKLALATHNPSVSSADIASALRELSPVVRREVIFGDGMIAVDNRPLRSILVHAQVSSASQRATILSSVIAQLSSLDVSSPPSPSGAAAKGVGNVAKSILRGRDFSSDPYPAESRFNIWLRNETDKFNNWLKRVFHVHASPLPTMSIQPWVARAILYTVAVGALALLCATLYRNREYLLSLGKKRVTPSVLQSALAMNAEEAALVASRDYDTLIALARQNAERGEHRNGYRLVYLATLVVLDTTGYVRMRRSRTNWEYLEHVRTEGSERVYELLLPMTQAFDNIWYGLGFVDIRSFDQGVMLYDRTKSLVTKTTAITDVKEQVTA